MPRFTTGCRVAITELGRNSYINRLGNVLVALSPLLRDFLSEQWGIDAPLTLKERVLQDPADTEKGRREDALRSPQCTTSSTLKPPSSHLYFTEAADGMGFEIICDKDSCKAAGMLTKETSWCRGL
jgi:hypothetical protein